jgi:predicted GNAT family N-acyltransferase
MKQKIIIKQALTESELNSAKEIRQQVFTDEQGIPLHLVEDSLNDTAVHVLVFVEKDVIATARMFVVDDEEGVIARVAVLTPHRGEGYGKLLVEELIKIAYQLNLRRITLKPHEYLEKFYSELGFTTVAGDTEIVGEHLLITMEKILSVQS